MKNESRAIAKLWAVPFSKELTSTISDMLDSDALLWPTARDLRAWFSTRSSHVRQSAVKLRKSGWLRNLLIEGLCNANSFPTKLPLTHVPLHIIHTHPDVPDKQKLRQYHQTGDETQVTVGKISNRHTCVTCYFSAACCNEFEDRYCDFKFIPLILVPEDDDLRNRGVRYLSLKNRN